MGNSTLDKQMIAFGILLLTGCSPVQRALTPASTNMVIPNERYVGEVVQPPILLQDFTMPASTGESMHLSDLNGSWRVMFFGYLHCPDFCPMTLTEYKRVKGLLGETGEQVKFLYVSVDGVRDTRLRATFTYDIEPAQIAEAIAWYIEQEPLTSQS